MITLKQIRAKRSEVLALQAALEAAQITHSDSVKALTTAADNLKTTKNKWVEGRDRLEEMGREFALNEGENDYTPPMTFEPPPGKWATVVEFPASVIADPAGVPIASGTISVNANGIKVKEYMGANGNMIVEIVDEVVPDVEGNLSYSGKKQTKIVNKYDPSKKANYIVAKSKFSGWCACNESMTAGKINGQPCTYHKQRGEFHEPMTERTFYWPLQEVQSVSVDTIDEI